jgi:hypothetical protein
MHNNITSCKILKIGRDNLYIFHFIFIFIWTTYPVHQVDEDVEDIEMARETEILRETEMVKDTIKTEISEGDI